jgi:hypothetical protein
MLTLMSAPSDQDDGHPIAAREQGESLPKEDRRFKEIRDFPVRRSDFSSAAGRQTAPFQSAAPALKKGRGSNQRGGALQRKFRQSVAN